MSYGDVFSQHSDFDDECYQAAGEACEKGLLSERQSLSSRRWRYIEKTYKSSSSLVHSQKTKQIAKCTDQRINAVQQQRYGAAQAQVPVNDYRIVVDDQGSSIIRCELNEARQESSLSIALSRKNAPISRWLRTFIFDLRFHIDELFMGGAVRRIAGIMMQSLKIAPCFI